MGNASPNFSYSEFTCPCGCGMIVNLKLFVIAELIRQHEGGKPISPSSAARCKTYNEKVQKEANSKYVPFSSESKHMVGIASDWESNEPKKLYTFMDNLFPDIYGIGLYDWGIHIDTRPVKARW